MTETESEIAWVMALTRESEVETLSENPFPNTTTVESVGVMVSVSVGVMTLTEVSTGVTTSELAFETLFVFESVDETLSLRSFVNAMALESVGVTVSVSVGVMTFSVVSVGVTESEIETECVSLNEMTSDDVMLSERDFVNVFAFESVGEMVSVSVGVMTLMEESVEVTESERTWVTVLAVESVGETESLRDFVMVLATESDELMLSDESVRVGDVTSAPPTVRSTDLSVIDVCSCYGDLPSIQFFVPAVLNLAIKKRWFGVTRFQVPVSFG